MIFWNKKYARFTDYSYYWYQKYNTFSDIKNRFSDIKKSLSDIEKKILISKNHFLILGIQTDYLISQNIFSDVRK